MTVLGRVAVLIGANDDEAAIFPKSSVCFEKQLPGKRAFLLEHSK